MCLKEQCALEISSGLSIPEQKMSLTLGLFQGPRLLTLGNNLLSGNTEGTGKSTLPCQGWCGALPQRVLSPTGLKGSWIREDPIPWVGRSHSRGGYFQGTEEPLKDATLISCGLATWLWHIFLIYFRDYPEMRSGCQCVESCFANTQPTCKMLCPSLREDSVGMG